ncbi:MAG: LysM peptidoglycan-binding domain-containing protein [Acidimicrobiia bacterium]
MPKHRRARAGSEAGVGARPEGSVEPRLKPRSAGRTKAIAVGAILALTVAMFSVEYTVERGDTLGRIARDNGVSLADLVALNQIDDPNLIYPGQVLVIPGEEGKPDTIHVVARGETLARIAGSYGANALAVARANSLVNPNLIYPGQKLVIPTDGSSSGPVASPAPTSDGESEGSTNKTPSGSRSGKYHVVKSGETLESIAKQYSGVSANDIAKANGVINGKIFTGTRLFLDGPSYTAGGSSGSGTYVVKSGDRLGDIAAQYETTISALAKLNKISNVNLIRAGQNLTVPGGGSSWVCPVSSPSYFNDWGFPRSGNRFHEGNDLFTKYGSPVKAPVSGTVELKTGSLGGLQFNLHGSDGVEYLGSHLSAPAKTGKVNAGDVIGYVGTSGNAQGTSPHLHFGMYIDGLAINPYPTLTANSC